MHRVSKDMRHTHALTSASLKTIKGHLRLFFDNSLFAISPLAQNESPNIKRLQLCINTKIKNKTMSFK